MNQKVLVVAAHPDDEVLGCGGTMAKHVYNNDEVHVLILAEGVTSRGLTRDRPGKTDKISELAQSAHKANDVLGVSSLVLDDFPDNRMDGADLLDVVKCIENRVNQINPQVIYTHHAGDLNIDHRIVHQAVTTAVRPQPGKIIKKLLFFEVPSSTEWLTPGSGAVFIPNWFVDISGTNQDHISFLSLKKKALEIYTSEARSWPHSRSLEAVEHLGRWRGASVGVEAAEAFVLGRRIV